MKEELGAELGRFREDRPHWVRRSPVIRLARTGDCSRTVGFPFDPKMFFLPLIEPLGIPRLEEDSARARWRVAGGQLYPGVDRSWVDCDAGV